MKTFSKELKQKWIGIMQDHADADRIIQGQWLGDAGGDGIYRGCFFGCAMQSCANPVEKASEAMHLPLWLLMLAEKIFEGLPASEALKFPVQLLESIPTDADIEGVRHEIASKRLRALPFVSGEITAVADLHDRYESVTDLEWESAARSARSAAWLAERDNLIEALKK